MLHRPFKVLLEKVAYSEWAAQARARSEALLASGSLILSSPRKEETFEQEEVVVIAALLIARKRAARVDIRRVRSRESRRVRLLSALFGARELLDVVVEATSSWDNLLCAGKEVSRIVKRVVRLEKELWEVAPELSFLEAFSRTL